MTTEDRERGVDRWREGFRNAGYTPRPIPSTNDALALGPYEDVAKQAKEAIALSVVQPSEWVGKDVPHREYLVEGLLPSRNVTLLSGDGGLGKTLLALQLMAAARLGFPWLGAQTQQVKSFGLFCEDENDELHRRMVDIAAHYGCQLSALAGVNLSSRVGAENVLVEFDRRDRSQPTSVYAALTDAVIKSEARLVIVDSLHDVFGGNEIVRSHARQFIGYLRRLAIRINGAVLVTAHPSAAGMSTGSGTSGSTGWNNTVRSRLYLTRPAEEDQADDGARILKTMKQNYGPRGGGIELLWSEGVFRLAATGGGDPYREAEAAFLTCLDKISSQRRYVSATNTSQQYAPTVFAKMPESRRLGRRKLAIAMAALLDQNKIVIGQHQQPNRHFVNAIMRAE